MRFALLFLVCAIIGQSLQAAPFRLSYTGLSYEEVSYNPGPRPQRAPHTTDMALTFDVLLLEALPTNANFNFFAGSATEIFDASTGLFRETRNLFGEAVISDGIDTLRFGQAGGSGFFEMTTDANGAVAGWFLSYYAEFSAPSDYIDISSSSRSGDFADYRYEYSYSGCAWPPCEAATQATARSRTTGTWQVVSIATVPLPASNGAFLAGIALLYAARRRRCQLS